jgi:hypothetical protein
MKAWPVAKLQGNGPHLLESIGRANEGNLLA